MQVKNTARMAGWQGRDQNRVCCPGHDQTDYVRRTRRTERAALRRETVDAARVRDEFELLAEGYTSDLG